MSRPSSATSASVAPNMAASSIANGGPTATASARAPTATAVMLVELPLLRAAGAEQMARDDRLLDDAAQATARRYLWSPPAVSLGKFQELAPDGQVGLTAAGIDVVRRPSGGRLVLHGEGFEWSFAVAVPAGLLPYGTHAAYRVVHDAMAAALAAAGVAPDPTRDEPYTRSALCFSSALRHDLLVAGAKSVAVAQVRRGDRLLVHGSVLERRPPAALVAAVETATGERWRGDGLEAAGATLDGEALWSRFLVHLESAFASVGRADV